MATVRWASSGLAQRCARRWRRRAAQAASIHTAPQCNAVEPRRLIPAIRTGTLQSPRARRIEPCQLIQHRGHGIGSLHARSPLARCQSNRKRIKSRACTGSISARSRLTVYRWIRASRRRSHHCGAVVVDLVDVGVELAAHRKAFRLQRNQCLVDPGGWQLCRVRQALCTDRTATLQAPADEFHTGSLRASTRFRLRRHSDGSADTPLWTKCTPQRYAFDRNPQRIHGRPATGVVQTSTSGPSFAYRSITRPPACN